MEKKGFSFQGEEEVQEHGILARHYRHDGHGTEVLHLWCEDPNKVFMIFFMTPPEDSTGLPHILEHMVLCGSKRFPLKEPFRELLKGSMYTFLNAFTYPDRTCYPVASKHPTDFLNLIEVYLDAVFNPLLSKESFYQEAWHLIPGESKLQGVVYSEMKGAYSSPEHLLQNLSLRSLYPGYVYGYDSGGDPKEIPSLDHQTLVSFHRRYYTPTNSKILLYGNLDIKQVMELLESFLSEKGPGQKYLLPDLSHHIRPSHLEGFYQGSDPENLFASLNWHIGPLTDIPLNLQMRILEGALLEGAGAALRKRLIDSGIGEDLVAEGLETELKYLSFHVGMKGIRGKGGEKFWKVLLDILEDLSKEGIPPNSIEAAINRVEFGLREGSSQHLPKGLILCLWASSLWAYGGDPLGLMKFEKPLGEIKELFSKEPDFLKGFIKTRLLDNPWYSKVVLFPKEDRLQEFISWERGVAEERVSQGKGFWETEYRLFQAYSSMADPEEAKTKIPRLRLDELPREPEDIPSVVYKDRPHLILIHPIKTSGVVYLDLGIPLSPLLVEMAPLVRVLGRALLEMGTKGHDLTELSALIGRVTGGLWPEVHSFVGIDGRMHLYLFLRAKFLPQRVGDFFDLLRELLFDRSFEDILRLSQILREEVARLMESLVERGHFFASTRAKSHFGRDCHFSEISSGISYGRHIKNLSRANEGDLLAIGRDLGSMLDTLLKGRGWIFNITSDPGQVDVVAKMAERFWEGSGDPPNRTNEYPLPRYKHIEGFGLNSQVYFVGRALRIEEKAFDGSWLCGIKYLRNVYLWEEVRMRGGAYGAYANLDPITKVVTFSSYRDPNPLNTLRSFEGAGAFLERLRIGDDELHRAIIASIGELDRHMEAQEKGFEAVKRFLRGETRDLLKRRREEVLSTHVGSLNELGGLLQEAARMSSVKILGPTSGTAELLKSMLGSEEETESLL